MVEELLKRCLRGAFSVRGAGRREEDFLGEMPKYKAEIYSYRTKNYCLFCHNVT